MTEPAADATHDGTAGVRTTGRIGCAIGAAALLAAVVVFWAGGPPYGVNIGGGGLYLLGLLAGLIGTVLLWMGWARRGVTGVALVLVCACRVVTIGGVAPGTPQLVLMAATGVALAAAALLARR